MKMELRKRRKTEHDDPLVAQSFVRRTLTSSWLQAPTTPENIENIDWTRAQLRYSTRVSFIVIVMTMQKHQSRNICFVIYIINHSQSSTRQTFTHFRFDMGFMWWQAELQRFTRNFLSNRKKKSTRSNPQTPWDTMIDSKGGLLRNFKPTFC